MKSLLFIGGPLILFTCFSLWSDLLTFGEQHPGVVHVAGAAPGGTFLGVHKEVYQCDESGSNCTLVDESTEFSEVDGLELEEQAIEYRDGLGSEYSKTKQPGLTKYANITIKRPRDFDWKNLKFSFDDETKESASEGVEMMLVDPPTMAVPKPQEFVVPPNSLQSHE